MSNSRAADFAIEWLHKSRDPEVNRDHVLNSLLKRPDNLSTQNAEYVAHVGIQWLRHNSSHREADRVRISLRRARRLFVSNTSLTEALETVDPYGGFAVSLERLVHRSACGFSHVDFQRACSKIRREAQSAPGSASFAIPALLVLACRLGERSVNVARNTARM